MRVALRRIRGKACGASTQEPIPFCPEPYVGHTTWAARFVLGLRRAMSISDVARFTGLHGETVKNIEKARLEQKCRRIRLNQVEYPGIDEVYLGAAMGFITVVRDLESGAVLFIGKGKGGDALRPFRRKLRRRARHIRAVAIDMANAYSAWVKAALPDADIVYDHFRLIKLMNERMDGLRRRTMDTLADEQGQELKNKRFLLLRNEESLSPDAAEDLRKLRLRFEDLARGGPPSRGSGKSDEPQQSARTTRRSSLQLRKLTEVRFCGGSGSVPTVPAEKFRRRKIFFHSVEKPMSRD